VSLLPALFALSAGALFGFNLHIQKKGLEDTDGLTGAFLSIGSMAAVLWFFSPFFIEWRWWLTDAAIIFMLCGLVFPATGQSLQIVSIRRVGPALTSAGGAFAPLFAVLPAVMFLGESFGLQAIAGMTLMMGGLILSAVGTRKIPRGWPLWALLLPLGASFMRGVVQPITKYGYAEVPSPYFSTLVMATVSTLVLYLLLLGLNQRPAIIGGGRGHRWFVLSGMINGAGILALNNAIQLGDVTVAAPLASTTPLWALFFGIVMFRHERLGLHHAIIALLVVSGAVLIVTR